MTNRQGINEQAAQCGIKITWLHLCLLPRIAAGRLNRSFLNSFCIVVSASTDLHEGFIRSRNKPESHDFQGKTLSSARLTLASPNPRSMKGLPRSLSPSSA